MASQETTLCVVNLSGMDIVDTVVSGIDNYDWDGDYRPDLNFQGAHIPNNNSRCEREEVNTHASTHPFSMTLTFSDGSTLFFQADQRDAYTKLDRNIPATGTAADRLQVYQTSGGYTNAFYVQSWAVPDHSGWMGELLSRKPDALVNGLTMPGSHDAGMYELGYSTLFAADEWVQTQALPVYDQLKAGSRYFDFRIYDAGGLLRLAHYSGDNTAAQGGVGPTLDEVLAQIRSFMELPAAAAEAVFLKFSHTYTPEAVGAIVAAVQNGLGSWMFTSTDPTLVLQDQPLSALSGRVVATFDAEFAGYWNNAGGVFRYMGVPNPPTLPDGSPILDPAASGLQVFDHYADSDEFVVMQDNQLGLLTMYGGYGKDYLFLLSWTLTGAAGLVDVRVLSTICNPWLPQRTSQWRTQSPKPNIVFIDFLTPWLCTCIIQDNG